MLKKIFIVFTPGGDSSTIEDLAMEVLRESDGRQGKLCTDYVYHQQVYHGYAHPTRIPGLRQSPLVRKIYDNPVPEADLEMFSRRIRASALEWNRQYFREFN